MSPKISSISCHFVLQDAVS